MEQTGAGRFSIKTLGCKLNRYEADQIAAGLSARGWHAVPFGDAAELVIVHTCTVTDNSDRKCRNYIRQGARFATGGKVVVTGCLGRRDPAGLRAMGEVLDVIDSSGDDLPRRIEESFGTAPSAAAEAVPPYRSRTRSYVKIQDGCDGSCSYCIVPSVRGKPVSRPFDEVIAHMRGLVGAGVPEIVFTGITIGKYEDDGRDLAALAETVLALDGNFRLRITSIEPGHVTPRLISLFGHPKLCDHIHLPLQSGSDRVLSEMNRPYTREKYLGVVRAFRERLPDMAIGADIIVGYPGETEDDFEQTLDIVRRAELSHVHQFSYSRRGGTRSASQKECDPAVVASRAHALKSLASEYSRAYADRFEGKILLSVIERSGEDGFSALSSNYLKASLGAGAGRRWGEIVPVRFSSGADGWRGDIVTP